MDQRDFALIEILVVVVVIALLAGGGLYLKYAQQSQSEAQIGANAIQQAQRVQQQVNNQTAQQQNAIDQLDQNGTGTPISEQKTIRTSSTPAHHSKKEIHRISFLELVWWAG